MAKTSIQEVEGDILLSNADLIAHGIATNDPFNSGLALSLRDRWPSMVRDYRHFAHQSRPKAGEIWAWAGVDEQGATRKIINLITQDMLDQGKASRPDKATLMHVEHTLKALAKYCHAEDIKSLALPRLATGVGGLHWADVKPLIQMHLSEMGIPVVIYETYRQAIKADEKL